MRPSISCFSIAARPLHFILPLSQLKCCTGINMAQTNKALNFTFGSVSLCHSLDTVSVCESPTPPWWCYLQGVCFHSTWAISFLTQSTLDQMDMRSGHSAPSLQIGPRQRVELRRVLSPCGGILYSDMVAAFLYIFLWLSFLWKTQISDILCRLCSLVLLMCKERQRWKESNLAALCNSLY